MHLRLSRSLSSNLRLPNRSADGGSRYAPGVSRMKGSGKPSAVADTLANRIITTYHDTANSSDPKQTKTLIFSLTCATDG